MLESKTRKRRRRLPWWQQWWRAWSVFRLLIWTIWVIYRERRRVIRARERGDYDVQPNIEVLIKVLTAFRQTAIKLGVLMIKLGQFLSSRADLLPERALATLNALQDEVPPAPFSHVVSMIETELGKPVEQIFSVLERKATAAASLGQVHKAILAATGEKVAVKVQRPNIDQLVRTDLSTLKFVIRLIMRFFDTRKFIDLMAVYHEFKRTVQTYFHQFFDEGFFHADPHPGNIFVKKGQPGAGPIIEFVDFGMVGRLTKTMKKAMKDLFLSFVMRDSHTMVEALTSLGFIGEGANIELIERGLNLMLQQFYGMTLGEARELEIPEVTEDVGKLLYGQPFQIPAQFAYTGRAVGTLVGVATGLAPDFNFVDVATPYARKFVGIDTENIGQTLQQLLSQLLETATILLKLPRSLERILTKLETGQIEIRIGLGESRGRLRRSDSAGSAHVFSLTLAFVASLAGSYLFTFPHDIILTWFCLILAAIIGLRLILRR